MEEIATFNLPFGYAQVAVFNSTLINPFNRWSSQHFEQGFSWRPSSVSFRLLGEFGLLQVKVQLNSKIELRQDSTRAILVPFSVDSLGVVEFASVDQGSVKVAIPNGEYGLVFETGVANEDLMWCGFTFILSEFLVAPRILRIDSSLSRTTSLIMETQPA